MATDPRTSRRRPGQTQRELDVASGEAREPLRGEDLSPTSKRVIGANLHERGASQVESLGNRRDMLTERVSNSTPGTNAAVKATNELKGVENVLESEALTNTPITPGAATRARTRLFKDAEARQGPTETDYQGRTKPQYPDGYGWYFSHRRDLNQVAEDINQPQESVVNASAVMAAANSPDNEKAAVRGFGEMLRDDPEMSFTPASEKKIGAPSGSRVSNLSSDQIAEMTMTHHQRGVSPAPPKDTRRGSTKGRNAAAVGFLRGELGDEDIPERFPAQSQAKLASYRQNIMDAEPNTGVEDEYMARYQDVQNPAQQRMDLFGLQESNEGILGTRSVEDTWMNAISSGQQLETIPGSKTSPAKNVSSDSQTYSVPKSAEIEGEKVSDTAPKVAGAAMLHAWNNARTTGAARSLSKDSPTQLPSTAVQEVSWTEARRQAGKDAAFSAQQRSAESGEQTLTDMGAAQGSMDPRNGAFYEGVRPRTKDARDRLGWGT